MLFTVLSGQCSLSVSKAGVHHDTSEGKTNPSDKQDVRQESCKMDCALPLHTHAQCRKHYHENNLFQLRSRWYKWPLTIVRHDVLCKHHVLRRIGQVRPWLIHSLPTSLLPPWQHKQRTLRPHRHGNPGLYSDLNVIMLITSLRNWLWNQNSKYFRLKTMPLLILQWNVDEYEEYILNKYSYFKIFI